MNPNIFSIVPIEVCQDRRLTLQQMRVLITLLTFRGKNTDVMWPTRKQIAERCGMHEANISAATSDLVELGWLVKEGGGGFSRSTRYRVVVPDTLVDSTTVVESTRDVDNSGVIHRKSSQSDYPTPSRIDYPPLVESTTRKELTKELKKTNIHPIPISNTQPVRPEGVIAVELRKRGVEVTSINPKLIALVAAGLTLDVALECLASVRLRKPEPEQIAFGYLEKVILSQLQQYPISGMEVKPSVRNPWYLDPDKIASKAWELRLVTATVTDERQKLDPEFQQRVFDAAGVTPEMIAEAKRMRRHG